MRDNINPKPETLGDILALALKRLPAKDTIEIWNDTSVKLFRISSAVPNSFILDQLLRRKIIHDTDTIYRRHAGKIEIVRAP